MLIKTKNDFIATKKKMNEDDIRVRDEFATTIIHRDFMSKISLDDHCIQQRNNSKKA